MPGGFIKKYTEPLQQWLFELNWELLNSVPISLRTAVLYFFVEAFLEIFFIVLVSKAVPQDSTIYAIRSVLQDSNYLPYLVIDIPCILVVAILCYFLRSRNSFKYLMRLCIYLIPLTLLPCVCICSSLLLTDQRLSILALTQYLFTVIAFGITVLIQLIHFQSSIKPADSMARYYNKSLLKNKCAILLIAVVSFLAPSNSWVALATNIALMLSCMIEIAFVLRGNLFCKMPLNIICACLYFLKLDFYLMEILIAAGSNTIISNNKTLSICILFIFQVVFVMNYQRSIYMGTLLIESSKIDEESQAELFIKLLLDLMTKQDLAEENLYSKGMITEHRKSCLKDDCICKSFDSSVVKTNSTASKTFYEQFLQKFVAMNILQLQTTFVDSASLKVFYLYMNVELLKNQAKAYHLLQQLIKQDFSYNMSQKWVVFDIRHKLSTFIQNQNQKKHIPHIELVFKYDKLLESIENEIKIYAEYAMERIQLLIQTQVDLNKVEEICSYQLRSLKLINQYYADTQAITENSLEVRKVMLHFLEDLLMDEQQANQQAKQLTKLIFEKSDDSVSQRNLQSKVCEIKGSCLIEIDTHKQNFNKIVNVTRHTYDVFGYTKEQCQGLSFKELLPECLKQSHQQNVEDWFEKGDMSQFNRLMKQLYHHKEGICFEGQTYKKIIPCAAYFRCMIWIRKTNDEDFLIMNMDSEITNLGIRTHMITHGNLCHFEILCPEYKLILPQLKDQPANLIEAEHFWFMPDSKDYDDYREMIAATATEEEKAEVISKIQEKLILTTRKVLMVRYEVKQLQPISKNIGYSLQITQVHTTSVAEFYLKYGSEDSPFTEICSKYQKTRNSTEVAAFIIRSSNAISEQIGKFLQPPDEIHKFITKKFFDDEDDSSAAIDRMKIQQSTTHDSLMLDYTFRVFIKEIKNKFSVPSHNPTQKIVNLIAFAVIILLIGILLGSFLISVFGLNSFSQLMRIDVSINHLLKSLVVAYGKCIRMRQYAISSNLQGFDVVYRSATASIQRIYPYIIHDFTKRGTISSYTNENLLSYLNQPLNFSLPGWPQNKTVNTGIFIENFYSQVLIYTTNLAKQNFGKELADASNTLADNWNALQIIRRDTLSWFDRVASGVLSAVSIQIILLLVLYLLLCAIIISALWLLSHQLTRSITESLQLYEYVSLSQISRMKMHLSNFLSRQQPQQADKYDSFISNSLDTTKKRKFYYKPPTISPLFFFGLLIMMSFATIVNSSIILSFMKPENSFREEIFKILTAESRYLENYIDMKSFYLEKKTSSIADFYKNASANMFSEDVAFVQECFNAISLLSPFQDSFEPNFISLLTSSICVAAQNTTLADWEKQDCKGLFNTEVIEQGVLAFMQFFQRKNYELNIILSENANTAQKVFQNPEYQDIDNFMSYVLPILELVHNTMLDTIDGVYHNKINICLVVCVVQAVVLGLFMIIWHKIHIYQLDIVSQLHGMMLIISPDIIKDNKYIRSYLVKALNITA